MDISEIAIIAFSASLLSNILAIKLAEEILVPTGKLSFIIDCCLPHLELYCFNSLFSYEMMLLGSGDGRSWPG